MQRKNTTFITSISLLFASVMGLSSCGGDGEVTITMFGEEFIEDKIPAGDPDDSDKENEGKIVDGWEVEFESYDVEIKDLEFAGEEVELDKEELDLTKKSDGGHAIAKVSVPSGTYSDTAFTIVKTVVKGKAEKGDEEKTFEWTFDQPVRYSKCESGTKVRGGKEATFQITMHSDHYLYDTLTGEEKPKLFFGALADADADGDGEITQAELADASIPDEYDQGSEKLGNMWEWLLAQNLTIAHANGEDHCKAGDPDDEDDDDKKSGDEEDDKDKDKDEEENKSDE